MSAKGLAAGAAIGLAAIASAASAQQQDGAPPMEVGTIELHRQQVPRVVTLPGRAVAYQSVDVRPRVDGVVEEILYKPGQPLSVGDPLFRIDDASYRAQVASDAAALATAEANLPVAQSDYSRAQQLAGRGYTEAEVESARAALAEAEATLDAANAALDYSRTQLGWTTISSPIEGRPDVAAVSVGDLVTAGQADALTTIVQSDPIYVDMLEASARMISVRQQIEAGELTMSSDLAATLTLENGSIYRGTGTLVSPGTTVSTTTGTFTLRFSFDNPHNVILPGMFLRGDITIGTTDAFLVPQRAATRNSSGQLTAYLAGGDGQSHQVTLEDEGSYGNAWIVSEGLGEGDLLIVDGLRAMADGQAVRPVPVEIDGDGVTRDLADGAGD
ncbi:efflux RND transporter periplasmic adaptor subunit [Mangrovicoccus ximenensis]|uniref:efflux RND transporter periplasmic adaptor subunit n=1 Tax=Mangrovicoccus ximenensis TaxID=1911570 RepID=UPI000D3A78B9|nr:efflux RND transporter periplasmic adaptor subunit [Mangrovicoccus ximenensis]